MNLIWQKLDRCVGLSVSEDVVHDDPSFVPFHIISASDEQTEGQTDATITALALLARLPRCRK